MKNLKGFQRDRLIYEFGILLQPFEDLVRAPISLSPAACRIAIAKVLAGDNAWHQGAAQFATFANDISFQQECQDISHVPQRLRAAVGNLLNNPAFEADATQLRNELERELSNVRDNLFTYIERVPVAWEPVVFEANTPFTSYLRIKESIAIVNRRLHYFDRYLKPDFFQLFLAFVDKGISIRLVTTTQGIKEVLSISDLACQQFLDYQLMEISAQDLHDRNLLVDDQMFSLGPGVDRAGIALTNFGPSDSSPEALRAFDLVMARGRVVHHS